MSNRGSANDAADLRPSIGSASNAKSSGEITLAHQSEITAAIADADVEAYFREAERQRQELIAAYKESIGNYGVKAKDLEFLMHPGSRHCA